MGEEWLRGFRSVGFWLGYFKESTAKTNMGEFKLWMRWLGENGGEFAGFTPDDLVEWQRAHPGDWRIVDLLQEWVRGMDVRASTKSRRYAVVRSFFSHNRAELPRDRNFRITARVPPVVGGLSVNDIRRIIETSNPMYRALFLCMLQGALGIGEALYWSRTGLKSVRRQLREGSYPLRIDLPGRKMNRNIKPYYTFIGRDAIEALENWLKQRPRVPHKDIFVTQFGTPLSKTALQAYWLLRLRRLGIAEKGDSTAHRTGKNIHELRDLFRTRWQKSGAAPEVAEFLMGHVVDPLGYNKAMSDPDYVADEYLKAEPWLNVVSEEPEKVHVRELHQLRREYEARLREVERRVEAFQETVRREMEEFRRIERM